MSLTDEQSQLAESEKAWLLRNDPICRIRQELDSGAVTIDSKAVAHAAESGFLALLTDDIGGTHSDLAVLTEAHGYAAGSLSVADAAIACWLLSQAQTPSAVMAGEGEKVFGVTTGAPASVPVSAGALQAGLVVVEEGDGHDVLTVIADPAFEPMKTLDLTRPWSRVSENRLTGEQFSLSSGTAAFVRDALTVHRALDAISAAARLLDMTVTYAGQRQQFGALIGSFQAVKHHCANMALGVEAGRATVWAAIQALDSHADAEIRTRKAAAAAAYAKAAAANVASIALQVHGGIGFTWEHDLHLFLRRIKVDEAMNGNVTHHRGLLIG